MVWDADHFWDCRGEYDVINIHWPEYLSFTIESYLHNDLQIPDFLLKKLNNSLEYWSSNAKIVHTHHNHGPHLRQNQDFDLLYKLIYKFSDLIVHFADYSIQKLKWSFPETSGCRQVVIPHQNYASLLNASDSFGSRRYLGIRQDTHVMLVPGRVKENEKSVIRKAFDAIPGKNKVLLAPGWKTPRRKIGYIRLREWIWKIETLWAIRRRNFRTDIGHIPEEQLHYYLNAADVLFIPRTAELNSGNIALGFTFGLVVVGKNSENIGEILTRTGNPTFEVGNEDSLRQSIVSAFQLENNIIAQKNKELALGSWSLEKVVNLYRIELNKIV